MAHEVTIPRLGWGMEKGTFLEWRKRDGDSVEAGEVLFVVEGDKAAAEVESLDSGVLRIAATAPAPGEEVPVGTVIAHLVAAGEAAPAVARRAAVPPQPAPSAPAAPRQPPARARRGGPAASPRARRVARELGVDLATVRASGTSGRIAERDVRAAATGPDGRSCLEVDVDAGALAALVARIAAVTVPGVDRDLLHRALLVRLSASAAASLGPGGASITVAVVGPTGRALCPRAQAAGVVGLARALGRTASGAGGVADLTVVDAGGFGADDYAPADAAAGAPLLVFGRPDPGAAMPVRLRFAERRLPLDVASALLARVREAIEAPDLGLAR